MLLQDIFKLITVSLLAQTRLAATKFLPCLASKLNIHFCTQQCGATTRTLHRPYRGSMTSHVQRVRIGVPLEMIRMVRMMRGAGVWRVPDAMGTGGALRAQVGKAQRPLRSRSGVGFKVQPFFFPRHLDGPRSAGWREYPDQRRRFPFDAREDERSYRRPRSGSGSLEDERDSLPEWCLEDADEEAGTFDSSGAFLSLKVR